MYRFLAICCAFAMGAVALHGADDTAKAAATRKKLQQKISVTYKDTLLRDVIEDLKEKVEGLGVLADTKNGVNLNSKITYEAKDKPVTDVLNDICTKNDMGYLVLSQQGGARDGNLQLTRGKERGYPEGEGDKGKPKGKAEEKPKDKPKDKAKTEEKPKGEDKPKAESDPDKDEADAARKLKFAKTLLDDKKIEKAKDRLEEIVKFYGRTKAGAEAKELLEKLDK